MASLNVGNLLQKGVLFGVAGWVFENALCGDRYSALFGGQKVPILPIYAVNGLALTAAAPYVSKWPIFARGLAYATVGSLLEFASCKIDRQLMSGRSWNYGAGDPLARASQGCVDFTHSALWGGLGLIAEKF